MERQSNRVSEQQRCAPSLHFGRGPSALLLHALYRTRPLCTPAPCLHLDEALLHYCSMPPFGRGPSALLLHAPIWTRPFCTTAPCLHLDEAPLHYCSLPSTGRGPFCKNFFCSRSSPLQNRQLYMLKDIANRQLSPISI
jgi:hypothetical protein